MLSESLGLSGLVTYVGSDPDPWAHVRTSDLFVFPVHEREGFGIALFEALLAGLPAIATRVPATIEVLPDMALYPYADVPALAGLLRRACVRREDFLVASARAGEAVAAVVQPSAFVDRYLADR